MVSRAIWRSSGCGMSSGAIGTSPRGDGAECSFLSWPISSLICTSAFLGLGRAGAGTRTLSSFGLILEGKHQYCGSVDDGSRTYQISTLSFPNPPGQTLRHLSSSQSNPSDCLDSCTCTIVAVVAWSRPGTHLIGRALMFFPEKRVEGRDLMWMGT